MVKTTTREIPEYISVGVVAKHCGVSNTTVLRWINNGEIPAFRLPGGHYRIDSRDFSSFMDRYHIPDTSNNGSKGSIKNGKSKK